MSNMSNKSEEKYSKGPGARIIPQKWITMLCTPLNAFMKAKGWNQKQLADETSYKSAVSISALFRGKSVTLVKYCEVLDALGLEVVLRKKTNGEKGEVAMVNLVTEKIAAKGEVRMPLLLITSEAGPVMKLKNLANKAALTIGDACYYLGFDALPILRRKIQALEADVVIKEEDKLSKRARLIELGISGETLENMVNTWVEGK